MMYFITGGAGSGKSAFAEELITSFDIHPLTYIATMEVWDDEGHERVARHRAMRKDKGFLTWECPKVASLPSTRSGGMLCEDLTNLFLNQWYGVDKTTAFALVRDWIYALEKHCDVLVLVANQITADGKDYDEDLTGFLAHLGKLQQELAQNSHMVYEVTQGIGVALSNPPQRKEHTTMTLIVGGRYQGKESYAQSLAQSQECVVISQVASWLKTQPSSALALEALEPQLTSSCIIVCDEVGCGVVPLDPHERAWRERVGQVSIQLAQRADVVIRMVCGIPIYLKGGQ